MHRELEQELITRMEQQLISELYELARATGECILGPLHIIDTSADHFHEPAEGSFRIYHAEGYCIDIRKELDEEALQPGEPLKYYFHFGTYFDGFEDISVGYALQLVKDSLTPPTQSHERFSSQQRKPI